MRGPSVVGREGFEPSTLGLRVPAERSATSYEQLKTACKTRTPWLQLTATNSTVRRRAGTRIGTRTTRAVGFAETGRNSVSGRDLKAAAALKSGGAVANHLDGRAL